MEFDELKNIWKEQNSKLEKSISLNQQLLKNTFTQKANGVIENLLRWEYFSLIEFIAFLALMSAATFNYLDDWQFLLSGVFIISFLVFCVVISIISIKKLNTINLFSQSIVETKQIILNYKKQLNRSMRIIPFITLPVIITFLLLGVRFIRNINLLDYPDLFIVLVITIIIISSIAVMIFHQTISRKLRSIERNLSELEQFKTESA